MTRIAASETPEPAAESDTHRRPPVAPLMNREPYGRSHLRRESPTLTPGPSAERDEQDGVANMMPTFQRGKAVLSACRISPPRLLSSPPGYVANDP